MRAANKKSFGSGTVVDDEHAGDQSVDGDDAGHDDWDQRLQSGRNVERLVVYSSQGYADTFMISSGWKVPMLDMLVPDTAVPYAAPAPGKLLFIIILLYRKQQSRGYS
jgi:hypothetical protein